MSETQAVVENLLNRGVLRREAVEAKWSVLEDETRRGGLAKAMVNVLGIGEAEAADSICRAHSLPAMRIAGEMKTAPANIFTEEEIMKFRVLPVFLLGLELTAAFVDPPSEEVRRHLQKVCGYRIIPVIAALSDFDAALKVYSGARDTLQQLTSRVDLKAHDVQRTGPSNGGPVDGHASETTMAEITEELLLRAVKSGASDIHVEPGEHELLIRFRVDGFLQRVVSLPMSYHAGIVSVVKGRSGMDMFERGVPQDGRITLNVADRTFDLRVSSLPLLYGEKLVLRILSKSSMQLHLDNLGFSEANLAVFRSLLRLPNGIVLVTGPTGSGKTTTLYAGLNEIRGVGKNITTIENPVEYKLDQVNQVQVVPERGLTFANSLRAILRQDPNVILLGEIRDAETGTIATEAALTGHLVLSTLHTNDAVGAIPRMINLGIESFWVSSSVIGVLAQRLVRRICNRCKEQYEPGHGELKSAGLTRLPKGLPLFRGTGCSYCGGTGYKGRVGIHEVLVITEEMREAIVGEVTTLKLRRLATENHFQDMYYDGMRKVLAGMTSLEEIQRVTKRTA